MGSRKLKSFILNPLRDKKEIEKRYDKIEVLMKEFLLKDELREYIKTINPLEITPIEAIVILDQIKKKAK